MKTEIMSSAWSLFTPLPVSADSAQHRPVTIMPHLSALQFCSLSASREHGVEIPAVAVDILVTSNLIVQPDRTCRRYLSPAAYRHLRRHCPHSSVLAISRYCAVNISKSERIFDLVFSKGREKAIRFDLGNLGGAMRVQGYTLSLGVCWDIGGKHSAAEHRFET